MAKIQREAQAREAESEEFYKTLKDDRIEVSKNQF